MSHTLTLSPYACEADAMQYLHAMDEETKA